MAELLEEIKKLPREQQLALAQQIWDLDEDEGAFPHDPEWNRELERRLLEARANGFQGTPADEVLARLRAANERDAGAR